MTVHMREGCLEEAVTYLDLSSLTGSEIVVSADVEYSMKRVNILASRSSLLVIESGHCLGKVRTRDLAK